MNAKANRPRGLRPGLTTMIVLILITSLQGMAVGHLPPALKIVAPDPDQPQKHDFRLTVVASSGGAEGEAVKFRVRFDALHLNPATGELSDEPPAFGEVSVLPGKTVSIDIKDAPAGQHRITLETITDHEDLTPKVTSDVTIRTSILPFAVAIVVILGSAAFMWRAARKKSEREDTS